MFQDFLRRNFKGKDDKYEEMIPVFHEPGKLYVTAKTHKFDSLDGITAENLKFSPLINTNRNIYIQCFKGNITISEIFV